jgi:NDP-sugar pyrophosphorylase family protein
VIGLALRIVVSVTTDVPPSRARSVRDGSKYGLRIDYHQEHEPLGSAGPLRAFDGLDRTFLAMDSDMLTIVGSARTVRAHYGVVQLDGAGAGAYRVQGSDERSETPVAVSIGIYVLEPSALAHVPAGGPLDSPDLVLARIAAGEPVGSHVHHGYWRGIGRHDDYDEAQAEIDVMLREPLPA